MDQISKWDTGAKCWDTLGHTHRAKMTGFGDALSSIRTQDSRVPVAELTAGQQSVTESPE